MTVIFSANAQTTILQEDFESNAPTWDQTKAGDSDGWKFGSGSSLSSDYWGIPDHDGKAAATNDDGCDCDKSGDYLMTPSIDLTLYGSIFLTADIYYGEATYDGDTETATVEVSTDGGTNWDVIETLGAAEDWKEYAIDLSAYAGQSDVIIAFHYNDNGGWLFGIAVDNVHVFEPLSRDVSVEEIDMSPYIDLTSGDQQIGGTLYNNGSETITLMNLNYTINGGAVNTESLSSMSIAPLTSYNFTHQDLWTPSATGTYEVVLWTSDINGSDDQNVANDSITFSVYVAASLYQRIVLFEEFTNTSCGPCAAQNPAFNALLNNNLTKIGIIKYHPNWPGADDPFYLFNPDDNMGRKDYYEVSGVPSAQMDGQPTVGSAYEGAPANVTQDMIDEQYDKPALFKIEVNETFDGATNEVTLDITLTAKVDYNSTDLVLQVVAVEKDVEFDSPPGNNGEKEFSNVMRYMMPDYNGTSLSAQTEGDVTTKQLKYTMDLTTVDASKMRTVVFIQDNSTKDVLQAEMSLVQFATGISSNEVALPYGQVELYPNPVNEKLYLDFEIEERSVVDVTVYDIVGQKVGTIHQGEMLNGNHSMFYDTTVMPEGVYFINIDNGIQTIVKKFVKL